MSDTRRRPPATKAAPRPRRPTVPRKPAVPKYVLRLYVTGMTFRSRRAIENIQAICEEHLHGRYQLDIIDIYERPYLAKDEQIVAAPTLIRRLPVPLRRFIGDLSDRERVLLGLDLRAYEK